MNTKRKKPELQDAKADSNR